MPTCGECVLFLHIATHLICAASSQEQNSLCTHRAASCVYNNPNWNGCRDALLSHRRDGSSIFCPHAYSKQNVQNQASESLQLGSQDARSTSSKKCRLGIQNILISWALPAQPWSRP